MGKGAARAPKPFARDVTMLSASAFAIACFCLDGVVDFVVSSTAAFRRGLRGAHSPLSPVTTTPLSQNKFKAHFAMKPRNLHFVQLFSRPAMNLELES